MVRQRMARRVFDSASAIPRMTAMPTRPIHRIRFLLQRVGRRRAEPEPVVSLRGGMLAGWSCQLSVVSYQLSVISLVVGAGREVSRSRRGRRRAQRRTGAGGNKPLPYGTDDARIPTRERSAERR